MAFVKQLKLKILRKGGRNMINKLRDYDFTIKFDHFVDFSVTAKSTDSTYNTLPHNQGFEF